jgi:plasmid maintenance system antidote protein VapI
MRIERVNIGEIIRKEVESKGMPDAKFAKSIGLQRQNIKKTVFEKHSLDTDLLILISEVLDIDFFQHYKRVDDCNKKDYANSIKEVKASITLQIGNSRKEETFSIIIGKENIDIK